MKKKSNKCNIFNRKQQGIVSNANTSFDTDDEFITENKSDVYDSDIDDYTLDFDVVKWTNDISSIIRVMFFLLALIDDRQLFNGTFEGYQRKKTKKVKLKKRKSKLNIGHLFGTGELKKSKLKKGEQKRSPPKETCLKSKLKMENKLPTKNEPRKSKSKNSKLKTEKKLPKDSEKCQQLMEDVLHSSLESIEVSLNVDDSPCTVKPMTVDQPHRTLTNQYKSYADPGLPGITFCEELCSDDTQRDLFSPEPNEEEVEDILSISSMPDGQMQTITVEKRKRGTKKGTSLRQLRFNIINGVAHLETYSHCSSFNVVHKQCENLIKDMKNITVASCDTLFRLIKIIKKIVFDILEQVPTDAVEVVNQIEMVSASTNTNECELLMNYQPLPGLTNEDRKRISTEAAVKFKPLNFLDSPIETVVQSTSVVQQSGVKERSKFVSVVKMKSGGDDHSCVNSSLSASDFVMMENKKGATPKSNGFSVKKANRMVQCEIAFEQRSHKEIQCKLPTVKCITEQTQCDLPRTTTQLFKAIQCKPQVVNIRTQTDLAQEQCSTASFSTKTFYKEEARAPNRATTIEKMSHILKRDHKEVTEGQCTLNKTLHAAKKRCERIVVAEIHSQPKTTKENGMESDCASKDQRVDRDSYRVICGAPTENKSHSVVSKDDVNDNIERQDVSSKSYKTNIKSIKQNETSAQSTVKTETGGTQMRHEKQNSTHISLNNSNTEKSTIKSKDETNITLLTFAKQETEAMKQSIAKYKEIRRKKMMALFIARAMEKRNSNQRAGEIFKNSLNQKVTDQKTNVKVVKPLNKKMVSQKHHFVSDSDGDDHHVQEQEILKQAQKYRKQTNLNHFVFKTPIGRKIPDTRPESIGYNISHDSTHPKNTSELVPTSKHPQVTTSCAVGCIPSTPEVHSIHGDTAYHSWLDWTDEELELQMGDIHLSDKSCPVRFSQAGRFIQDNPDTRGSHESGELCLRLEED